MENFFTELSKGVKNCSHGGLYESILEVLSCMLITVRSVLSKSCMQKQGLRL